MWHDDESNMRTQEGGGSDGNRPSGVSMVMKRSHVAR